MEIQAKQVSRTTYHDQRRGVCRAMCHLVKPRTLLFDVALVTVALQHGLADGTTARTTTSRGILEACLQTVAALDRCRGRSQVWNRQRPVCQWVRGRCKDPTKVNRAEAFQQTYGGLSDSLRSK